MEHPITAIRKAAAAAFAAAPDPTVPYRPYPQLGPEPDARGVAIVRVRQLFDYTDTLSRGAAPGTERIAVELEAAVLERDEGTALTVLQNAYLRFAESVAEGPLSYRTGNLVSVGTQYLAGEDQVVLVDATWTVRED